MTLRAFLSAQKSAQMSKTTQKSAQKSKSTLLSAQKSAQRSGFAQKSAQMSSSTQKRAQKSWPLKKVLNIFLQNIAYFFSSAHYIFAKYCLFFPEYFARNSLPFECCTRFEYPAGRPDGRTDGPPNGSGRHA